MHPAAFEPVHAPAAEPEPETKAEPEPEKPKGAPRFAKCLLKDPEEEVWNGGTIYFSQMPGEGVRIAGVVDGITPGEHGFHVHTSGDLRGGCSSTEGHYIGNRVHVMGTPMLGDLPNAVADEAGVAHYDEYMADLNLSGGESIIGRSLVIHAGADKKTGAARIACCTIGIASGPSRRW